MRIAVVTDSTADVPADLAEALGLRVVPLSVRFGQRDVYSRITITDEEFYAELAANEELPATSQPVPVWFEEAWGDAADEGFDAVVSLHVSSELSGTVERARVMASDAPLPVHVVDSRQVSGGLALQVLAAVRAAGREGADVDGVLAAAAAVRDATRTLMVVDTLEFLRRGGRLTGAQALVGNVLRVRPVLAVEGGRVELLERARTWARARERIADLAAAHAGDEPVHAVLAHALAPDRAAELLVALRERVEVAEHLEVVIGPVVGTHIGPGAVGVSLAPARMT